MKKAVIFDLDGLLVDSEIVSYKLYRDLLDEYNYSFTMEEYTHDYSGRTALHNMETLIARYKLPFPVKEGLDLVALREKEYLNNQMKLKPGAGKLLSFLKENQVKILLASSSTRERALTILNANGVADFFDYFAFGAEIKRGKPYPDIFLKACEYAKEAPENCLVLEDSEAGIKAAYAAGIDVLCIPDLKMPADDSLKKATAVFSSLDQVIEWLKTNSTGRREAVKKVQTELFSMQDLTYRNFHAKLMPTIDKDTIIGVRTPSLRTYAKKFGKTDDATAFLEVLPHKYYEENNLHGLLIEQIKDYPACIAAIERFLPYVDNWATCDLIALRTVKKHLDVFIQEVCRWMTSDHPYIIRFGIGMLMRYYLDERFKPEYPEKVAEIKSDEYYVNMMRAWYFATALAKQYERILPYLEEKRLDTWTHNKTIQKAVESYRITPEQKSYLKTLRVKK